MRSWTIQFLAGRAATSATTWDPTIIAASNFGRGRIGASRISTTSAWPCWPSSNASPSRAGPKCFTTWVVVVVAENRSVTCCKHSQTLFPPFPRSRTRWEARGSGFISSPWSYLGLSSLWIWFSVFCPGECIDSLARLKLFTPENPWIRKFRLFFNHQRVLKGEGEGEGEGRLSQIEGETADRGRSERLSGLDHAGGGHRAGDRRAENAGWEECVTPLSKKKRSIEEEGKNR